MPDTKTAAGSAATPFVDELFARTLLHRLPFQAAWKAGFTLLFLLALFWAVRFVFTRLIARAANEAARREEATGNRTQAARIRTLAGLLQSVAIYLVGFLFLVAAMGTLGFNLAGVIGTAGVAGVAVGFGAQKIVKDGLTGAFLLLEDQYAVGDYVTIGNVTGTVEEIALRTTRIRDDDGRLYILSNGDITQVCNQSRAPVASSFEISVAASAADASVNAALRAAFTHAAKDLPLVAPPHIDGVSAADATKTTYKITYTAKQGTRPAALAPQLREVARRALREADIALA